MSLTRINTNPESLLAGTYIKKIESSMSRTMARLSTGSRLVTGADDPSGVGISGYMQMQLGGTRAAMQNAEDVLSLYRVADASMQGVLEKLNRARELAVRSSNDITVSTSQKALYEAEWREMIKSIDDLQNSVTFNGVTLFDGSLDGKTVILGPNGTTGESFNISLPTIAKGDTDTFGPTVGLSEIILSDANAIGQLSGAIGQFSEMIILVANQEKWLEETISRLSTSEVNLASVQSRISDADMAAEISQFTKQQILSQSATAMLAQANAQPQSVLSLLGSI